jgi:hypothetical protein
MPGDRMKQQLHITGACRVTHMTSAYAMIQTPGQQTPMPARASRTICNYIHSDFNALHQTLATQCAQAAARGGVSVGAQSMMHSHASCVHMLGMHVELQANCKNPWYYELIVVVAW